MKVVKLKPNKVDHYTRAEDTVAGSVYRLPSDKEVIDYIRLDGRRNDQGHFKYPFMYFNNFLQPSFKEFDRDERLYYKGESEISSLLDKDSLPAEVND